MVKLGTAKTILTARQKITLHVEIANAISTCVMMNIDFHTAIAGLMTPVKELSLRATNLDLLAYPIFWP